MSDNFSSPPLFSSYKEALNSCITSGYQYQRLVDLVVRKNKLLQDSSSLIHEFDLGSMRIAMAVGLALDNKKISILDFGGGGGFHWFVAKTTFSQDVLFDWRVVETPLMSKAGCELLAGEGLQFFSEIKSSFRDEEKIDLVFTSSALQYCEDPLRVLKEIVDVGAKYIFITRTPFSLASNTIISNQRSMLSENGPGPMPKEFLDEVIEYPITYISKIEAERILLSKYKIRFCLKEELGNLFFGNLPVNNYYGFFCELK